MKWEASKYTSQQLQRMIKNIKVSFSIGGFVMGSIFTYTAYPTINRVINLVKSNKTQVDPAYYQEQRHLKLELRKGVAGMRPYVVDSENKNINMGIGYDMHEQSPGGLMVGLTNRIDDGYFKKYIKDNPEEIRTLNDLVSGFEKLGYSVQRQTQTKNKKKFLGIFTP